MRWMCIVLTACAAFAQGTEPKAKATDYEVHGFAGDIDVGAEYMVHSYASRGGQMFIAKDVLVVEVALYPPKDGKVTTRLADFVLQINGHQYLNAMIPAQVLQMQQYGGGNGRGPHIEGGLGPVILGRPRSPGQQPMPSPPRAPDGMDKGEPESPDQVLTQTALPEGTYPGKVSGFVYFPFKGKPASVKTVELQYKKDAVLKLK